MPHLVVIEVLLAATIGMTLATAWATTDSILITSVVALVTVGPAVWMSICWWRAREPGLLEYVVDAAWFGVTIGAAVTQHWPYVIATVAAYLVLVVVANASPSGIVDYLTYAWWTPVGAARHATAVAALDAAHRAHALLRDPRLDGATADELVAAFVRDSHDAAADAVDEPRDSHEGRLHPPNPVCSVCGAPTRDEPCVDHQPRLYEASLEVS